MVTLFLIIIFVLLVGFGIAFYFMYRHYEYQLKREIKRAQKHQQSSGTRFYPASDGTVKVRRHHARLYLHRG